MQFTETTRYNRCRVLTSIRWISWIINAALSWKPSRYSHPSQSISSKDVLMPLRAECVLFVCLCLPTRPTRSKDPGSHPNNTNACKKQTTLPPSPHSALSSREVSTRRSLRLCASCHIISNETGYRSRYNHVDQLGLSLMLVLVFF